MYLSTKLIIYQYFSGKEEIATSVIETIFGRISMQFDALKQDEDHPIVELCSSLNQVKTEVARLHPLFLEDIQKLLPDLWQKVEEFRTQRIMQIESSIKAAQKIGAATDVDARLATVIFLETVQSLIRPDTLSRHGYTASEALGALISIFIKGITQK